MTTDQARRSDASTYALAAAGPLIALLAGSLWLSSRLVSLTAGRGWVGTPGSPTALVLGVRRGAVVLSPAVVVLAVLLLAVPSGVALRWWLRRSRRRVPVFGRARWASRRDLVDLVVDGPTAGRIGLGRAEPGGQLLAAEPHHSVLVFGPSGSGKTCSVVVPALLGWVGPAVVTSVKTDVLDATESHRAGLGPVFVFDPTCSTGRPSATWTPLVSCATWQGARDMAEYLTAAADSTAGHDGSTKLFWRQMGSDLLAPLLFAAAATDRPMADVVRWVQRHDQDEVVAVLTEVGEQLAVDMFTATCRLPAETKGSAYASARVVLSIYSDPAVAATADSCDIDPDALLDRGGTLYLCAPLHAQDRLRPLFEALIASVVRAVQDRAQRGRRCDPGLLLLLDEAGNVAPLRDLPSIVSTGRGVGLQVVSVWQDRGQLEARYGRDAAGSLVANHRARLALSGIADLGTLAYFSEVLGDTNVDRVSTTDSHTGRSTSTSQQRERLAPADALRQLPLGCGLLVYGTLPPARVTFRLPSDQTARARLLLRRRRVSP